MLISSSIFLVQEQATIEAHAIKTEFFRQATVSEICTRLISNYLPLTSDDLGKANKLNDLQVHFLKFLCGYYNIN
jgi:hypothetical protein